MMTSTLRILILTRYQSPAHQEHRGDCSDADRESKSTTPKGGETLQFWDPPTHHSLRKSHLTVFPKGL